MLQCSLWHVLLVHRSGAGVGLAAARRQGDGRSGGRVDPPAGRATVICGSSVMKSATGDWLQSACGRRCRRAHWELTADRAPGPPAAHATTPRRRQTHPGEAACSAAKAGAQRCSAPHSATSACTSPLMACAPALARPSPSTALSEACAEALPSRSDGLRCSPAWPWWVHSDVGDPACGDRGVSASLASSAALRKLCGSASVEVGIVKTPL